VKRASIPILARGDAAVTTCGGAEPFALMVLGDSMAPEFCEGEVIVIEPEGLASDGAYVLACVQGEWIFRRLVARAEGWRLAALDARYPPIDIADLAPVRGVVIQKSRPGRRGCVRFYASAGRSRPAE
jgi:SOS-response transcriptional repressor LexA